LNNKFASSLRGNESPFCKKQTTIRDVERFAANSGFFRRSDAFCGRQAARGTSRAEHLPHTVCHTVFLRRRARAGYSENSARALPFCH
ncbi:hypothetical protein, partial [Alistipes ihumii]